MKAGKITDSFTSYKETTMKVTLSIRLVLIFVVCMMCGTHANAASVLYWNMDNISGTTVLDSSGNGLNGKFSGGTIVNGKEGKAIEWGEENGNITYLPTPGSVLNSLGKKFTIEAWIYPKKSPTGTRPFGSGGIVGRIGNFILGFSPKNKIVVSLNFSDTGAAQSKQGDRGFSSVQAIPLNQWTHIAVVVDTTIGTAGMFVNGKMDSTISVPENSELRTANPNYSLFARGYNPGDEKFVGVIDEVKIRNEAMYPLREGVIAVKEGTAMRGKKKLIEVGWDMPDTRWLRENLKQMEEQPFDGVVVNAVGARSIDEDTIFFPWQGKKDCWLRLSFVDQKWQREWFQSSIDDLKACQFTRFTDNFLMFGANPGNVDWFDDAGWKNIVEHWQIAAWIAKQGGLKGLLFDPEPYTNGYRQFKYVSQPQYGKHTFDEYCEKVRERGRQVMKAVAVEYPDITIFCYFMNIVNLDAANKENPKMVLQGKNYNLYPAFIDGWLDACLPSMKFVDGCEVPGFGLNSPAEYSSNFSLVKNDCQQLVSPENRAKYRTQVKVGFPIWMNVYFNPPGSTYSIDMKGMSPVERLRYNASSALRVSDEYVWIYSEIYPWWSTSGREPAAKGMKPGRWPEILPGCDRALRTAGS